MGLFQRSKRTLVEANPVAATPPNSQPLVVLFAALGWWLDSEGVRDFTMLDTPAGGMFIKGVRPRMNYRATATEIVTEHFDAARLRRLVNDYQQAVIQGGRARL